MLRSRQSGQHECCSKCNILPTVKISYYLEASTISFELIIEYLFIEKDKEFLKSFFPCRLGQQTLPALPVRLRPMPCRPTHHPCDLFPNLQRHVAPLLQSTSCLCPPRALATQRWPHRDQARPDWIRSAMCCQSTRLCTPLCQSSPELPFGCCIQTHPLVAFAGMLRVVRGQGASRHDHLLDWLKLQRMPTKLPIPCLPRMECTCVVGRALQCQPMPTDRASRSDWVTQSQPRPSL
jgi:hypothetical protein